MLKKVIKIIVILFFLILVGVYVAFRIFTAPKSDEKVLKAYGTSKITPVLTKEVYEDFDFRKLTVKSNDSLPTMVFVHGTIGSLHDFSKYMTDSLLQLKSNMVAYDRVGYNYKDKNHVQESIAFERDMLKSVIKDIPADKVILVGYSYGGPIALSVKKKVRDIVLLAPAVHSKVEPMPWMINFYKWKATRWLVPRIWKEASKEKLSHQEDLKSFESDWDQTPNKVTSIHGNGDWIVPYENSKMLEDQFPKHQFELITIPKASHGLVWTNFEVIKKELLKILD